MSVDVDSKWRTGINKDCFQIEKLNYHVNKVDNVQIKLLDCFTSVEKNPLRRMIDLHPPSSKTKLKRSSCHGKISILFQRGIARVRDIDLSRPS